jgi:hypothetical protein
MGAVLILLRGASNIAAGVLALAMAGALGELCHGALLSQAGFKVLNTNTAATQTVTACAKMSQSFFIIESTIQYSQSTLQKIDSTRTIQTLVRFKGAHP